jgi:hypothetical protein
VVPDLSLALTVSALGGVATREQLVDRGFGPRALTRAVARRTVLRLRRGWYATPDVASDVRVAVMLGGRLGAVSSAGSRGWWTGLDGRVHVSLPPHGNRARPGRTAIESIDAGIVTHWRERHPLLDRDSECWRESPETTLAQVLRSSPRDLAVGCADSAIRTGGLSRTQVSAVFSTMPRRVQLWERYVDGETDSGLESIVRIWLMERGIPFSFHPTITGVGEVDFLVGSSLIVETDGRGFHDGDLSVNRDRLRDNIAATRGYITARLSYPLVMFDWPSCERRILEHLGRHDHRRRIR